MNFSDITTTQITIAIVVIGILAAGIGAWLFMSKRRTEKLRSQFGGTEYSRALKDGGSRRQAEAVLDKRADRVEGLHIRALGPDDRARFVESWRKVQTRFVDGPGGAVAEADQLLGDVMSARGYPVSNFDQRSADISVSYPLVLENYRAAHEIAVHQSRGQADTEELRQAMIHYRSLFEELVAEPELARAKAAAS